jgi:hypothetical protein
MERMQIDIMGVAETFWDDVGEFQSKLPTTEEEFKVIYSGGNNRRRGVAFIMKGRQGQLYLNRQQSRRG